MHRTLVLVVIVALATCVPPPPTPMAMARAVPDCAPLRAEGDDFSDLAPLASTVGTARVVALGEATHADGTTFAVKARLVRWLHDALGFEVLAFESSLWACESEPGRCLAWPWDGVREVDAVLRFASAHGMTTTGFDPQLTGGQARLDAMETWIGERLKPEPALAARLRVAFSRYPKMGKFRLLSIEDRSTDETSFRDARAAAATKGDPLLTKVIDDALVVYAWHAAVGADRSTTIDWDGHAAVNDVRDRGMADDVRWLLDVRYPGKKVILWTANTHAAKDATAVEYPGFRGYRTMGSWLGAWLGKDYVALAVTAYEGRIGNAPTPERDIGPAPANALEASCAASTELGLLTLGAEPAVARFIGFEPFRAPWGTIFDAGIAVRTMKPATR